MKSLYENYYRQIGFPKENSYYSMKRLKKDLLLLVTKLREKIPNDSNAKEYYQTLLKN